MPVIRPGQRQPFDYFRGLDPAPGQQPSGVEFNEYLASIPSTFEQQREGNTLAALDARTNQSMAADLEQAKGVAGLRNMGYGLDGMDPRREREQETFGQELQKAVMPQQVRAQGDVQSANIMSRGYLDREEMISQRMRDIAETEAGSRVDVADIGLEGTELEQRQREINTNLETLRTMEAIDDPQPHHILAATQALEALKRLGAQGFQQGYQRKFE